MARPWRVIPESCAFERLSLSVIVMRGDRHVEDALGVVWEVVTDDFGELWAVRRIGS